MKGYVELKGYEGLYWMNKNGILRNKRGLTMEPLKNDDGYLRFTLFKDGKKRKYFIHRLVCNQFIPNPSKLPQVNHKNLNRSDNRVPNLEWCSIKENALKRGERRY